MSNLGNLYFDIALRDMTDADIDKIKKKLEKVGVKMGVDVDRKTFEANIKEALKKKTFKVNIEASKNIKKAAIEANKNVLGRSVSDFLKDNTFKANVDLVVRKASVQQAIREAFAQAGLKYDTTASDARQNLIDTRTAKTNAYVEAQRALTELRKAQAASAHAANQQADAMERVNKTGERQKGVMATIREQVANAYAIYRVGRFLEGVIRISGEFQQQHVALQTILGDAQKADVLFSRIKGLAVESPFKFGELTGYAKQLAAFSIPYEELFDTLKRFGDLSAGLGVDMGRIILAYGQVRSAEFLKGTELRQFTEAGIPLVTELAKRYTELEGTLVSVGDVYDRISKKQVAFSDVKAVLWDLTSEGGRFFNMQSELTDTLKGKLDKLIDSYEIFLADLGKSNSDVLGGTLDALTEILGHWREVGNAILGITVAYGSYKAAVLAVAAAQKVTIALETIQGIVNLTRAMQGLTAATKAQAVAQGVLNAITSANPFVLAATILGSIAGLFIAFREETESEADAIARLRANMEDTNRAISEQEEEATKLISIMKDEKRTIDDRNRAYDGLMEMYGLLFPNMTREQVLMLDEVKIRKKVADAAKNEAKEKARLAMVEAQSNLNKAQSKYNEAVRQWEENPRNRIKGRTKDTPAINAAKAELDKQRNIYNSAAKYYEDLLKKEEVADNARKARWHKESTAIAESTGFFALAPDNKEVDVWEYFDRIKQGMDDIKRKKELLNPESDNYSTMLGNLDDELKAYKKIYYDVLGGKNEEAIKAAEEARKERERRAKEEAKQNKKLGEEAAKAYAEGVKSEMARIATQWDLYKQLFEATGDKRLSMNIAFDGVMPNFDNYISHLKGLMQEEIQKRGLGISVADLLSEGKEGIAKRVNDKSQTAWTEDVAKNLNAIIDSYNNANKKLREESVRNFIDIIKNSKDFAQQIADIDRKLQKDLSDLAKMSGGTDSKLYNRRAEELIKRAEEEKTKVNFEEFKKSSDWVKVFDDLDRVSDATLDNMISKIEEFAKQAHLSEEVTKQLVDAMAKLRKESIERNPLQGFKDAWERLKDLKSGVITKSGMVRYGSGTNEDPFTFKSKKEVDDAVAEANDDLEKATLAIAGKFNAVADAANMLSGVFKGFGGDLETFGGILNGIGSGAKSGAGIASALGIAGPWGAIAGAALGLLSSAFEMHDKAIQKEIEASEARIKMIDNLAANLEKRLSSAEGGIYSISIDPATKKVFEDFIEGFNGWKKYQNSSSRSTMYRKYKEYDYLSKDTIDAMQAAISNDSYYSAQLASLKLQKDELNKQKKDLEEAKDVDETKINDKITEIEQIEHEIAVFRKTMMDAIYGIDFKDWASQFTDSIVDAWAKGEDAADAYQRTVSNVMRNVAASVIQQSLIGKWLEDNMENVLALFERNGGVITDDVFNAMAELASGIGGKVEEVEQFMDYWEKALNKYNLSMKDLESTEKASSGLSKGIQGVTEDTANLLSSYVNSMRADLSVNRTLIEQLVNVGVPQMSMLAEAQLQQLQQVAANTKRNADAADRIYELVNKVVDKGSNKLKI